MVEGARSTFNPTSSQYIESLPNELLANIFSYLDAPQPSASYLLDEPRFDITESDTAPIKAASLVSKRWRQAIIPLLFKHAQCNIQEISAPPNFPRSIVKGQIEPFYKFITANELRNIVISFTLLVHDRKICYSSEKEHGPRGFSDFWSELFWTIDPLELLIVAPSEALGDLTACSVYTMEDWMFDCPCQYLRLQSPKNALAYSSKIDPASKPVGSTCEKLLTSPEGTMKEVYDPLSSEVNYETYQSMISDSAASKSAPHIEEDTSSSSPPKSGEYPRRKSPNLWEIRPWSSLLLNEGSFIKAYSTYEFWLRQPPSILSDLLGDKGSAKKPLISPSIRDLSYIGLFPMSHHFGSITSDCPRVDRLYIQLVPRNDILQQKSKMNQVEAEDLWMERNSCYALLMRELFTTPPVENFKHLKIFESGDAADEEAWLLAVEYVKRNANGWKIASQGVFVKDLKDKRSGSAEDDAEPSALSVH